MADVTLIGEVVGLQWRVLYLGSCTEADPRIVAELDKTLLMGGQWYLRQFEEAHMMPEHGKDASLEQAMKTLEAQKRMTGQVEQTPRSLIQITVRPGRIKTARAQLRVQWHRHRAKVLEATRADKAPREKLGTAWIEGPPGRPMG